MRLAAAARTATFGRALRAVRGAIHHPAARHATARVLDREVLPIRNIHRPTFQQTYAVYGRGIPRSTQFFSWETHMKRTAQTNASTQNGSEALAEAPGQRNGLAGQSTQSQPEIRPLLRGRPPMRCGALSVASPED